MTTIEVVLHNGTTGHESRNFFDHDELLANCCQQAFTDFLKDERVSLSEINRVFFSHPGLCLRDLFSPHEFRDYSPLVL